MSDIVEIEGEDIAEVAEALQEAAASDTSQATYLERVRSGEIEGPLFQHLADDDTWVDFSEDEVDSSSKSNLEKQGWYEVKVGNAKAELLTTDYVALKIAEGAATADDYAEVLAERKALREQINAWQAKIAALQE